MKKIILNVDDFGLTKGINQAVFELNELGVVKSTTALVNSPYFAHDIKAALKREDLGVGIHLTIDLFDAQLYHPSLCDENNKFYTAKTHDLTRGLDSEVVYAEWKAQIEKFINIAGVKPSHIDSHHHVHILNHNANIAVARLAKEYQLPVREFKTESYSSICNSEFYNDGATVEQLKCSIHELIDSGCDYLDVMIHPAIVDDELMNITSYNTKRKVEYDVLASNEFQHYLSQNQIEVSNYK